MHAGGDYSIDYGGIDHEGIDYEDIDYEGIDHGMGFFTRQ